MGIFNKIKSLFSNDAAVPVITNRQVVLSGSDKRFIEDSARSMVNVINESLKIANESVNYDTRISRARTAKNTLLELIKIAALHPDISITSISAVERSIEAVENETQTMKPIIPIRPNIIPVTAKEANKSHNEYMANIMAEVSDAVDGVVYSATLQLRTPLWILQKDGERWFKGEPPVVGEPWMGIWLPHVRSWKELGFDDMPEYPEASHSSDIGPVVHSQYLPFLIDIRSAVETDESIQCRIELLRNVMRDEKYIKFVKQHSGQNRIIDFYFPPVLDTIPGINSTVSNALCEIKITTIRKLRKTTDKELLAIKGVGSVALKKLRDFSDNYTGDDMLDRVDAVKR